MRPRHRHVAAVLPANSPVVALAAFFPSCAGGSSALLRARPSAASRRLLNRCRRILSCLLL